MAEQKQPGEKQAEPLYLPADFYLLRAPALPAQVFIDLSSAGHVGGETAPGFAWSGGETACTALLLRWVARPEVQQALAIASPSLLEGLQRFQRGEATPVQQKRLSAGLLRYLIRMSTRPTPFGLFAGVGLGYFGQHTDLSLGEPAIEGLRTRPDMHWLLALLRRIEEDKTLVARLRVRLNQTAYLAGERALLPFADTYGAQDTRAISLRATSVVRKVFDLAREFLPYRELQAALHQAFPRATSEQVERTLWQLWEHGFLVSELHPPLTDARPDQYIRTRLDALQGSEQIEVIKEGLDRVLGRITALDQAGIGAPVSLLATLVQEQEHLVPAKNVETLPLQVDSRLQLKTSLLHRSIGQVAALAAAFLLRTTPRPAGFRPLQEYRMLFLEKYGEYAEVPVLDLLSPEHGLDAPAAYGKPPRTYERPSVLPPPEPDPRDQYLVRLLMEAVKEQSLEVELTEEIQRQLERWSPRKEEAPLSLEVYLQLHADSCAAIDRGEWTAVVGANCGSPGVGRTFGRFYDLLGAPGVEHLRDLAAREEALQPEVIFAELSYQPWQARLANVAIRPPLRAYEIAVGTTPSVPPERVLTLSDLVVGVHNGRFYLRSLRLDRQVRVCQSHMLNALLAPNVCRFLLEIAHDGIPFMTTFDWGNLASAPFLPRLVIKTGPASRLVVALARWHLQAGTITASGEGTPEARWFQGLQRWREQWQVPRYVYLTEGDNRLLLDLENPLIAGELRDEMKKLKGHRPLALDEVLPDFEHLWLRDTRDARYFSEIVVPLLRADAFDSTARPVVQQKHSPSSRPAIAPAERKRFPGEEWVYLKLYAAPGQHEELLAGPMRELVEILHRHRLLDRWFFIRYADPEPHLRLRFHAKDPATIQPILALVLPWSAQLARRCQIQRVALDTYEREVERYGGPEAIDLLEQAFTVDSVLASDLLALQHAHRLMLDPRAVAVFTLDHFFAAWGYDRKQRLSWTYQASEKYAFSKEFRPERRLYCDLLAPHGQTDPDLAAQRALLLDLLCPHDTFLGALGAQVRQLAEADRLLVAETSLLSSLAHMHVNRLLGIDRTGESQIYAFWRHTLNSLERRPEQDHALDERGGTAR